MYNSVLAVFLLEAGLVLSKPYGANGVVESGPAPVARDNIQSLSAYRPPPPPYTSITGPMGSLPFIRLSRIVTTSHLREDNFLTFYKHRLLLLCRRYHNPNRETVSRFPKCVVEHYLTRFR